MKLPNREDNLEQALSDLVKALDNTFISSWQSTAGWQKELDAARECLYATDNSTVYAWRNPSNGVIISNDKKQNLLGVGQGYPNFSEPLYRSKQ